VNINFQSIKNEIHLWRIPLDQPEKIVHSLDNILSDDEIARAARFRFEHHQRRFRVSHAALRFIFVHYLGFPPRAIQFKIGRHGKPYLTGKYSESGLQFNLAHSHEIAVVGVTRDHEIGVDIEHLRPNPNIDQIAQRFFSKDEQLAFDKLPEDQQIAGFYNCLCITEIGEVFC